MADFLLLEDGSHLLEEDGSSLLVESSLPGVYTSVATGNWNDSTKWSPAGIPGNNDTATIASGHTITIPDGYNAIVGTSPATGGTTALTISTGGALVGGGGTSGSLKVRGPVTQQNAPVTLNAGFILEFDASLATTPASQTYRWDTGSFFTAMANCTFTINGTSGSHVTIRSNSGGGNGYFSFQSGYGGECKPNWSYADFTRIGDATNPLWNCGPNGPGTICTILNCTATSSGIFTLGGIALNAGWSITGWREITPIGFFNSGTGLTSGMSLTSADGTATSGRTVDKCVFVLPPGICEVGCTYKNSYFTDGYAPLATGSGTHSWTLFDGNFVRWATHTGGIPGTNTLGPISNCYLIFDCADSPSTTGSVASAANPASAYNNSGTLTVAGTPWTSNQWAATGAGSNGAYFVVITSGTGIRQARSIVSNTANTLTVLLPWDTIPDSTSTFAIYDAVGNPHGIEVAAPGSFTFTGNVWENLGCDSNGDCFLHFDQAYTYTLTKNIILPNAAGDNTGTLITLGGTATSPTYVIEHNTVFTGAQDISVGEGGAQAPNQIASFQGNIMWCDPAKSGMYCTAGNGSLNPSQGGPYKITNTDHAVTVGSSTSDIVTAGKANYNCGYGYKAAYAAKGYNILCSVAPGANDVDADPSFASRWSNLSTWAVSRGSSATTLNGRWADAKSYLQADPTLVVSSLIPYIQNALTPGNSSLRTAAHDGTTIGAVQMPAGAQTFQFYSDSGVSGGFNGMGG